MGSELLLIFLLILANGVFSMAEIAIVSSRKSRLESLAKKGDAAAKVALQLHNEPTRFLSTVQVGITLIGILTGTFGDGEVSTWFEGLFLQSETLAPYAHSIALGIVVILITFFSLIIGELVPKQIGLSAPEEIAKVVGRPLEWISSVTKPFVWLLSSTTHLIIRLLRIKETDEPIVTEEEIKSLVAQGANSGDVDEVEHDIIQRVFNLGDRKVGSLMTNRIDLEWIDLVDDFQTNREIILSTAYSALPVCEDGIDNVKGILSTKTFYKKLSQGIEITQFDESYLQKPLFIPENMTGYNLLEKFRELQTKVGIVVDEFGAVQGMVTMSDLVNALVGEMEVPVLQEDHEIIERTDGSFLIDALLSFDEFIEYFELEDFLADEERSGFHTLGGFILHLNEQIPKTGEIFVWKDFSFEVVDMDGNRIDKILVKKGPSDEEEE